MLARIPVRTNHDDRYFSDRYQALPLEGYTSIFEKLLALDNITVRLETDFHDFKNLNLKISPIGVVEIKNQLSFIPVRLIVILPVLDYHG